MADNLGSFQRKDEKTAEMKPEIIKIDDNTYRIEDDGVRFFVLTGTESALMIDSGMNTPDAKKIAEEITDLPLKILNTHADPDHVSGNAAFTECYLGPKDEAKFRSLGHEKEKILPVKEGDVIDLGGRKLIVIDLPGHTEGSIAVLDAEKKVLIGGDSIQSGHIYMFGRGRSMEEYRDSLEDLLKNHGEEFDIIYPSHDSFPVGKDLIPRLIDAAETVLAGRAAGKDVNIYGTEVTFYDFGFAGFLCDRIE